MGKLFNKKFWKNKIKSENRTRSHYNWTILFSLCDKKLCQEAVKSSFANTTFFSLDRRHIRADLSLAFMILTGKISMTNNRQNAKHFLCV